MRPLYCWAVRVLRKQRDREGNKEFELGGNGERVLFMCCGNVQQQ